MCYVSGGDSGEWVSFDDFRVIGGATGDYRCLCDDGEHVLRWSGDGFLLRIAVGCYVAFSGVVLRVWVQGAC